MGRFLDWSSQGRDEMGERIYPLKKFSEKKKKDK